MKRYSFRLATVLRIRRAEEERGRAHLVDANRRLHALIEAREHERARYVALGNEKVGGSFDDFRQARFHTELAGQAVSRAERAVTIAAAESALAQVEWKKASQRVKVLERIEERYRAQHAALALLEDVATADDFVLARYSSNEFETPEYAS